MCSIKIKDSILLLLPFLQIISCKKQLKVDSPVFTTNKEIVYKSDASAAAALDGIYTSMSAGSLWRLSPYTGLSSDELTLHSSVRDVIHLAYYKNALTASSSANYTGDSWNLLYNYIYLCNEALEGLTAATELTTSVKTQLTGEAKFIRAFSYFYLLNLYGDVPYTTSTDYKANSILNKTSTEEIYNKIIIDLIDAKSLLSSNYLDGLVINITSDRVRPTKWAAAALLARIYLYTAQFNKAELESTEVISNTALFSLPALNETFLRNSQEAIWQLQPVNYAQAVYDASYFVVPATGFNQSQPVYLSDRLLSAFEAGDSRRTVWVDSVNLGGTFYHYVYKYRQNLPSPSATEFKMILRLSEQYLIRAEARIRQSGKINDGINDLNVLRTRARGTSGIDPLPELPLNMEINDAVDAVAHERQVELFTEWGDRWLNLKRTGKINEVMSVVTPEKGGIWNSNWQLYPIPYTDIQQDPNLKQNEGYN
jgi:starch-binding outer membrane protein, SusD/RagB family